MNNKIVKFMAIALMSCLFMGNITISAAENNFIEVPEKEIEVFQQVGDNLSEVKSSPSLAGCTIGIGVADGGLSVTFSTSATQEANEIGVKSVMLQEKTWYGWKDIPISNHYTNNSDFYTGEVIYTNAVAGKTYRAYCTHYAKFGNTELTLYTETNNFVCN